MRKLAVLLFFTTVNCQAFSQNAFHEAKILSRYVNRDGLIAVAGAKLDTVKAIFKKYNVTGRNGVNIFLDTFLATGSAFSTADNDIVYTDLMKSTSSLGRMNVANVADGIARFLIERGQQELNVAFFHRFHKFLTDPKYPEFQILFPTTVEFFKTIDISRYEELLQTLREAFLKDLTNLLTSVNQLIDHQKYAALLRNFPEIRAALRVAKVVAEMSQSEEGILPDSLIRRVAEIPELANTNLGNALTLLQIVSQSLREKHSGANMDSTGRRWVKLSDFNEMIADKNWLRIYVGLLCQEMINKKVGFKKDTIVMAAQFLNQRAHIIFVFTTLIENFALLANDLDNTIKDVRVKLQNGKISNEDYYTYVSKAINIIEFGFKVANAINPDIQGDRFIVIARNGNELYKSIYTKNYSNAVMNAYTILNEVFSKRDELVNASTFSDAEKASLKSIKEVPKTETVERILKYGNFMAAVVKAESGEEVQKAIEAAALPAGSYSIKQNAAFNFSVNGYIGYALDFNGGLYAQGVYAPVGFSLTAGPRKRFLTPTLFLGLIDVGSLALYRLQEGETAELKQEVRLESIFSPSAQLFVGIRKLPIVIGAGWRRTPKLFFSNPTSFKEVAPTNVFNVSVLVDIPLFTLINRQFYKKQ